MLRLFPRALVAPCRRTAGVSRWFATHAAPADAGAQLLRFCIVGSGPAGCYTAEKLMKRFGQQARVDLLDRLPTPFGLVRSGVAPDHQDTKKVLHQLDRAASDPRCSYFGNVAVGKDVSVKELRRLYHAVVLAYGAESDRRLGIPGEDAEGVLSAREFVWWYNGHPDAAGLPLDLAKVRSVAICGVGNVALDCARILTRPPDQLSTTDIASHALKQLQERSLMHGREVHLVARRGPVQAACTPKELKELVNECGAALHITPVQLVLSPDDQATIKTSRIKRRVHEVLTAAVPHTRSGPDSAALLSASASTAQTPAAVAPPDLHFHFYRNPVEILFDEQQQPSQSPSVPCQRAQHAAHLQQQQPPSKTQSSTVTSTVDNTRIGETSTTSRTRKVVRGLRVEVTELRGSPAVAVGTNRFEDIEAQLVLVSIGYKGLPLAEVPFDHKAGVVPNVAGRVLRHSQNLVALAQSTGRDTATGATAAATAAVVAAAGGPWSGTAVANDTTAAAAAAGAVSTANLGSTALYTGIGSKGEVLGAGSLGSGVDGTVASSDGSNGRLGGSSGHGNDACSESGQYETGLYVTGWLKRGPTGIIGTNLVDADETVASIAQDIAAGILDRSPEGDKALANTYVGSTTTLSDAEQDGGLAQMLRSKGIDFVTWVGWQKLDAAEVTEGQMMGKVREKVVDVPTMLRVCVEGH